MVDRIPANPRTTSADVHPKSDVGPESARGTLRAATPSALDRRASLVDGDDAAYEELVRNEGPRMHALACRYLKNRADADDAVQDAFVAFHRGIGAFDGRSSVETWLHRIVVNRAIDMLRRRLRRSEVPLPSAERPLGSDRAPERRSAEAVAETSDTYARVVAAVDRLPAVQRVVVRLRDIEGLGLDATADALGVNRITVRVRLHRARRSLRAQLARSVAP